MRFSGIIIFLLVSSLNGFASEGIIRSDITLEVVQFEDDDNADTFENQRSVKLHLEGEKIWGNVEGKFSLSGRLDDQDEKRNVIWSEDTYLSYPLSSNLTVKGGFQVYNFSYMEAFHPLDSLNARIIDVSLINSEKMGEPFVSLQTYVWDADLKIVLIPYPIRPVLPGKDSRLNLPEDLNKGRWIGQDGEVADFSDHFFVSFEKTFDTFDILALFTKGMDRSRLLIGTLDYSFFGDTPFPDDSDVFTPFYYERYLSGLNGVYNFDSFQLKGSIAYTYYLAEDEVLVAESETEFYTTTPSDYTAAAFGIEKPISHSGGYDSTFLLEYQYIFVDEAQKRNFPTQNDIFYAWRFSFNDVNSKQITLSGLQDLQTSQASGFAGLSYSQRLYETWKIEVSALTYFIPKDAPLTGLGFFRDKGNINLKIQKFF